MYTLEGQAGWRLSRFVLVLMVLFVFAGCGGGGGGGTSASFSGNTNPAVVDSVNASDFAEGVVGGIEVPFLFSLGDSSASMATVSSLSAHVAAVMLPANEHYEGSCGGTLDISYSLGDSEVSGTAVAVSYCEDGTNPENIPTDGDILDGSFTITIGGSETSSWENVTFVSFSSVDTSDGTLLELDGTVNLTWPVGGDPYYLENIVVKLVEDGETYDYWLQDFRIQRDTSGMSWQISGRVYYGNEGYVSLETTVPLLTLSPPDIETGIESGQVVMHGDGSDGRLTIADEPRYLIELWNGSDWLAVECFDDDWNSLTCPL